MLIEKILEHKKSKIRVGAPTSNWASMIGHPCERKLVYERTCPEKKPVHNVDTQTLFDEGKMHEKELILDLIKAGVVVEHIAMPFEIKPYNIRGKVDLKTPINNHLLIVEAKSLTPHIANKIRGPEDFFKYWWTYYIPAQLTCYMLGDNQTEALWITKNRATGKLFEIPYKLDVEFGKELCEKAERINNACSFILMADEKGTAIRGEESYPHKINDNKFCDKCPFVAHCCPDINYEGGVGLINDPELEELLEKRAGLAPSRNEYNAIDKEVKSKIKGCDSALIGRFHISGNWVEKAGYEVKAGKHWRAKIEAVE